MARRRGNVHVLEELVGSPPRLVCVARWYRDAVNMDCAIPPQEIAIFETWRESVLWARHRSEIVTAIGTLDGELTIYSAGRRQPPFTGPELPTLDDETLATLEEAKRHALDADPIIHDGPPIDTYWP